MTAAPTPPMATSALPRCGRRRQCCCCCCCCCCRIGYAVCYRSLSLASRRVLTQCTSPKATVLYSIGGESMPAHCKPQFLAVRQECVQRLANACCIARRQIALRLSPLAQVGDFNNEKRKHSKDCDPCPPKQTPSPSPSPPPSPLPSPSPSPSPPSPHPPFPSPPQSPSPSLPPESPTLAVAPPSPSAATDPPANSSNPPPVNPTIGEAGSPVPSVLPSAPGTSSASAIKGTVGEAHDVQVVPPQVPWLQHRASFAAGLLWAALTALLIAA